MQFSRLFHACIRRSSSFCNVFGQTNLLHFNRFLRCNPKATSMSPNQNQCNPKLKTTTEFSKPTTKNEVMKIPAIFMQMLQGKFLQPKNTRLQLSYASTESRPNIQSSKLQAKQTQQKLDIRTSQT